MVAAQRPLFATQMELEWDDENVEMMKGKIDEQCAVTTTLWHNKNGYIFGRKFTIL